MVREGYKNSHGVLAHAQELKDEAEALIGQVGVERVKVSSSCKRTYGHRIW